MDTVKFVPMLVGLLLAVVMVGAVFVPVISSSTTRTITTEIENEGAEWLKLGYNQGTDYSFTVGIDGEDNFTVGTQTGEYKNLICYADNERTLFVSGDYWYLLTNGENPSVHKFTDNASVTNASGTLTILDGSETVYTGASPTWAYVPDANGVYGFFTEGGLNLEEGKPKVAVGSYAGVFAYNETVVAPYGYGDLGLTMSGNYADGEVIWELPSQLNTLNLAPTDTLEPAVLDLEPISLDPVDLGGSGSVGLMAVPTPTYTDGVWGFDLVDGNARIVSYSGTAGDIVVPSTVTANGNTYTVAEFGKGGSNETVFDTSLGSSTITFPDTLVKINNYAMSHCSGFTGPLVIPDSVTTMGYSVFNYTSFTSLVLSANLTELRDENFKQCTQMGGSLELPKNLTKIGIATFNANKFDGVLVFPETLTTIGGQSNFNGCNFDAVINLSDVVFPSNGFSPNFPVNEILNLGDWDVTNVVSRLPLENIQDYVSALGYIAPTSISESEVIPIDSPVAGLMQMLPLIAGVGALLFAVGTMIYTRF